MSLNPLPDPLPEDRALVSQVIAGDRDAFGVLVRRYERAVRTVCWSVLRDHHLASDAAQDAFVEAFRGLSRIKDPAAFAPWVITIARNRALSLSRGRKAQSPLPPDLPDRQPLPNDEELLLMVANLPEQERLVVMLRFLEGYAVNDVARILGRPPGTVTKQLSRAYERLRTALEDQL